MPWVCIGDFNEITRLGEKTGGSIRVESQMQKFRECLDFCGLKDLGFTGLPFTWCNRRFDGTMVWVKLDRATAIAEWLLKFPSVRLHHLFGISSYHKPIWLCFDDVYSKDSTDLKSPLDSRPCGSKTSTAKGWFTPLGT